DKHRCAERPLCSSSWLSARDAKTGAGAVFAPTAPEMQRLRQVLALEMGAVVADVGAGKGELTIVLAREVGSEGHVFSTEIDLGHLQRLREAIVAAKLDN